jgi:hypothetical protein
MRRNLIELITRTDRARGGFDKYPARHSHERIPVAVTELTVAEGRP